MGTVNKQNITAKTTTLENWIDEIGLGTVRQSDPVQRLKRIRFLGTMPYITDLAYTHSRYDHSLAVAKLADAMGEHCGLSTNLRRQLVLMALLHDIGHLPFSHGSEVFFRQTWGRYHAAHGSRLASSVMKFQRLSGRGDLAAEIQNASEYLREPIQRRRRRSFEENAIYEIFHGPLSADALDGICRACDSISLPAPNPMEIIPAIFRKDNTLCLQEKYQSVVEEFLTLEQKVYQNYVYSSRGLVAEAMLTRALEITFSDLIDKKDFLSLDDDSALERINANWLARELMTRLESRDLFYSLREVAPEKHRLVTSVFTRLKGNGKHPIEVKKALEAEISNQAQMENPDYLIIHLAIKLTFKGVSFRQFRFPGMPLTLTEVAGQFGTKKTYGDTIEVVFPSSMLPKLNNITIPRSFIIPPRDTSVSNGKEVGDTIQQHAGTYMTPPKIARFLVHWAIHNPECSVLDPASGEGTFLRASFDRLVELGATSAPRKIQGIEANDQCRLKSLRGWPDDNKLPAKNVIKGDFFDLVTEYRLSGKIPNFDAIVGNPPYIRAHRFQGDRRKLALEATQGFDVRLSQRSSSWAPFLICASALLKKNGRLAMVLPTELLSADYAKPVREYLRGKFSSLTFVLFRKLVFHSAQQDVLLLLAANDEKASGIRCIELDDDESVSYDVLNQARQIDESPSSLDRKWTRILVSDPIVKLIESLLSSKKIVRLGEIVDVSLGRVTGDNGYFLLTSAAVNDSNIDLKWLSLVVPKAFWLKGLVFSKDDWRAHEMRQEKAYILSIPPTSDVISDDSLRAYLESGKRANVDQKQKCRTRWPWYSVPMQPPPDAFLTYMSGSIVRLVLNYAKANSTNNIHNVNFKKPIDDELIKAYTVSFYSSLTALSTEIVGRSYGGGVLKLEIGEAREIMIPNLSCASSTAISHLAKMFHRVDSLLRTDSVEATKQIDQFVLRDVLNLSDLDVRAIAAEAKKLKKRRLIRK